MSTATAVRPSTIDLSAEVIYTQDIARAAREFARENGVAVGTRGRVSVEHLTRFLRHEPAVAREMASRYGIPVSKRGRLSEEDAMKVAVVLR